MGVKTKSGQFSIEFIIVFGVMLTILAFITMPLYKDSSAHARKVSEISQAREAANEIAEAMNSVYSGGIGSRQTVEFWLPEHVENVNVGPEVDEDEDNRMDVQIWFESQLGYPKVIVNTLLSSKNVEVDNEILIEPENRTLHRTTFSYKWDREAGIERRIVISDSIIERKFVGSENFVES